MQGQPTAAPTPRERYWGSCGGCLQPLLHLINNKASRVTSSLQSPMGNLTPLWLFCPFSSALLKAPGGLLRALMASSEWGVLQLAGCSQPQALQPSGTTIPAGKLFPPRQVMRNQGQAHPVCTLCWGIVTVTA